VGGDHPPEVVDPAADRLPGDHNPALNDKSATSRALTVIVMAQTAAIGPNLRGSNSVGVFHIDPTVSVNAD
jgi:hypothetical protein